MTAYIFEQMTQAEASTFKAGDSLSFSSGPFDFLSNSGGLATVGFEAPSGSDSSTRFYIYYSAVATDDVRQLYFPLDAFSAASLLGHVSFPGGTLEFIGTDRNETITGTANNDAIYGVGGHDIISGGAGMDYINGGGGNDHIYGNALTSLQGAVDGDDYIFGGLGNDYIQGNAGNDNLYGDEEGDDSKGGSDRIYGGQGDDYIHGGPGNDTANGNQGNDGIDGGEGNDVLRGGKGDDGISGGNGNDIIYGDLGDDRIAGDGGYDVLFGGDGADVFLFGSLGADKARFNDPANWEVWPAFSGLNDAPVDNVGNAAAGDLMDVVDVIGDFEPGVDKIDLASVGRAAELGAATDATAVILIGAKADTVKAALDYAQQLMDRNGAGPNMREIAAIAVGGDTYLFTAQGEFAGVYSPVMVPGTTIDTAIKLVGVSPSALTASDFI